MNKSSNFELTDFRKELVESASHYSKKNLNRIKVSLPKIAGYKGDKSPAWDAILTFWFNVEVNQSYIDEIASDFSNYATNIIAKLCKSVVVQEK